MRTEAWMWQSALVSRRRGGRESALQTCLEISAQKTNSECKRHERSSKGKISIWFTGSEEAKSMSRRIVTMQISWQILPNHIALVLQEKRSHNISKCILYIQYVNTKESGANVNVIQHCADATVKTNCNRLIKRKKENHQHGIKIILNVNWKDELL